MNLNPLEIKTAKDWYLWLWFSPLLTIPTLIFMGNFGDVFSVLISACWHLILFVPALNKERSFVRWHGRQALMLAGIRTIIALGAVLIDELETYILAIPILIIIWLAGNLWGRAQASKGQCSLMCWFGHQIPPIESEPADNNELAPSKDPDALVKIFRFSPDLQKRKISFVELKRLGLVEHFDNG